MLKSNAKNIWSGDRIVGLSKRDLERLIALRDAPDTFYASNLENVDINSRGGIVNGWARDKWIEPTGNTKTCWFQVDDDTMKRGEVKEWRKTPKTTDKLTRIIPMLEQVIDILYE